MRKYLKTIKKTMIISSIILCVAGLIILMAIYLPFMFNSDENVSHDFYLRKGYIHEQLGTTGATYYRFVNDDNVEYVFDFIGSEMTLETIKDLEEVMQAKWEKEKAVKVWIDDKKKEKFEAFSYIEVNSERVIFYDVLKRKNGDYYVQLVSNKNPDTIKTEEEYMICTGQNMLCVLERGAYQEYILFEDYICRQTDTLTPEYYIRLQDDSVASILREIDSEIQADNIEQLIAGMRNYGGRDVEVTIGNHNTEFIRTALGEKTETYQFFQSLERLNDRSIDYKVLSGNSGTYLSIACYVYSDGDSDNWEYTLRSRESDIVKEEQDW